MAGYRAAIGRAGASGMEPRNGFAGAGSNSGRSGRLVIFDCDGVLVDSEILACHVQARAVTAYGLALTGEEVAARFLGMSAKDMRTALERDLGRPLPDDHETRCGEELFELFRRELKPITEIAASPSQPHDAGRWDSPPRSDPCRTGRR